MDITESADIVNDVMEEDASEKDMTNVVISSIVILTTAVGGFFAVRQLKKRFTRNVTDAVIAELENPTVPTDSEDEIESE